MLKIKELSVSYNDMKILENINLEFKEGSINVISGLSGCGKTTLIKTINGIIPELEEANVEGEILFNDHNLMKKNILTKTNYISMVFQNPKTQFYCINSTDELAFGLENRNIERKEILEQIKYYTNLLEVNDLLNKDIFSLSGGEKQLLAICAVSCLNNDIYLFDEPSASLDKESIESFKKILKILKDNNKIIIVVEHRLYYLTKILDSLTVIENKQSYYYTKEYLNNNYKIIQEKHNLRSFKEVLYEEFDPKKIKKISLRKNYKKNEFEFNKLKCLNFQKKYDKPVLDLSIGFNPGVYFIIGKNGVGKSTFINCLCKTIKCKGKRYYNNKQIKKTYNLISLVMQDVNYQVFTDSCFNELKVIQQNTDIIYKCLDEVGLLSKKDLHPQTLSGGEKQRLLIAKVKASDKSVIVLDEPTSGLDRIQMQNMSNYLKQFEKKGKIVLVITHDYELIREYNSNIIEFID